MCTVTQHPHHILRMCVCEVRGKEQEGEGEGREKWKGGREIKGMAEGLVLDRFLRATLPPTSTLDEPAVVVDTLLHSLVLPAVVDDEWLTCSNSNGDALLGKRGEDTPCWSQLSETVGKMSKDQPMCPTLH